MSTKVTRIYDKETHTHFFWDWKDGKHHITVGWPKQKEIKLSQSFLGQLADTVKFREMAKYMFQLIIMDDKNLVEWLKRELSNEIKKVKPKVKPDV